MIRFLISTFIILVVCTSYFSQLTISPYHGFPNTLKISNIKQNPNYINEVLYDPIDEKISKIGTIGLRININPSITIDPDFFGFDLDMDNEYDIVYPGFSLDLNYTSCDYALIYSSVNNYTNANHYSFSDTTFHVMEVSLSIFRFLLNFHAHFSNSLKSDPYIAFGIGGRIPTESFYSTNTEFTYQIGNFWNDEDEVGHLETFISLRLALGYNYYFTKNFGFMFELGMFGGGFIRTGVNIRFLK